MENYCDLTATFNILIFGIVVLNAICYIKKRDRQVDETAACGNPHEESPGSIGRDSC